MSELLVQGMVGFLGVLAGTAVSWGYMKAKVDEHETRLNAHAIEHAALSETLKEHGEDIAVLKDRVLVKGMGA